MSRYRCAKCGFSNINEGITLEHIDVVHRNEFEWKWGDKWNVSDPPTFNEVMIDDTMIANAHQTGIKRIEYEYNRSGYGDNTRITMIEIGTLGELCFNKFLETNKVNFSYDPQVGEFDKYDFIINGVGIIEVKSTQYKNDSYNGLNLLYGKDQLQKGIEHNFSYCIQIMINQSKTKAIIVGYIDFLKIMNYPNKNRKGWGDDYKVSLKELTPIWEMIK